MFTNYAKIPLKHIRVGDVIKAGKEDVVVAEIALKRFGRCYLTTYRPDDILNRMYVQEIPRNTIIRVRKK